MEPRPRPMCRDCADYNGVCPHDGSFCSLDVERRHDELMAKDRMERMRLLTGAIKKVLSPATVNGFVLVLQEGLAGYARVERGRRGRKK